MELKIWGVSFLLGLLAINSYLPFFVLFCFFLEVNYCLYVAFIFKKVFGTFNKCSRGLINVLKSNS